MCNECAVFASNSLMISLLNGSFYKISKFVVFKDSLKVESSTNLAEFLRRKLGHSFWNS